MQAVSKLFASFLFGCLSLFFLSGCPQSPITVNAPASDTKDPKTAIIDVMSQYAAARGIWTPFWEKHPPFSPGDPPLEEYREVVVALVAKLNAICLADCPDDFKDAFKELIQLEITTLEKGLELQSAGLSIFERSRYTMPLVLAAFEVRERLKEICQQFELDISEFFQVDGVP